MQEVVNEVNQLNGIVIPTHPFRGNNSIGEGIRNIQGLCALEGYNGYSHHSQNKKALNVADALNLPFTGGSDAHAAREVGSCYTEFTTEVKEDNLVDLLRAGQYRGIDKRKISRGWPF